MKLLIIGLCIFTAGCASTKILENGKVVFKTQMNCSRMEYRSPSGSVLIVTGMNHSRATTAGMAPIVSVAKLAADKYP